MFTGTHVPLGATSVIEASDKTLHFLGYMGLTTLLSLTLQTRYPWSVSLAAKVALVVGAYGIFDELTQLLVGRDCSIFDWFADVAGISTGLLIATGWAWVGGLLKRKT